MDLEDEGEDMLVERYGILMEALAGDVHAKSTGGNSLPGSMEDLIVVLEDVGDGRPVVEAVSRVLRPDYFGD